MSSSSAPMNAGSTATTSARERVAVGRRRFDDEAALGADGHDHRVLHGLRLHQPEDLGAEVFAAIRPADAAARDAPGAQVDAFDARRRDEDLEHRQRLRAAPALPVGSSLNAIGVRRPCRCTRWCGASRARAASSARRIRSSSRLVTASSAVVSVGDLPLVLARRRAARWTDGSDRGTGRRAAREVGMRDECGRDVVLAERRSGLAQVMAVRAQHRDLAPREPGGEHEPVERVVLGRAAHDGGERVLEDRAGTVDVERGARRDRSEHEPFDPRRRPRPRSSPCTGAPRRPARPCSAAAA